MARALIDRGNLDAREKIRPERLINWFRNTSTLIVGNVAYYVRNVMLIHGELESIVSSAYKHERSYWGLTGNLDVIPYISVEDRHIGITSADSNISMCFILEIDNELTKILINNGVLRAELTILVDCAGNINIVEFEGYSYRCYKTRHIALGLYENEMQITIYMGAKP